MANVLGKGLRTGRNLRRRLSIAVSPFTFFILGFGLCYWIMLMFTMVVTVECEYAIIWISGWFEFKSLFQLTAIAIGLCATLWIARVVFLASLSRLETVAQLVFILGLIGVLVAQKAYLFPYGTPSNAQVERIAQLIWRNDIRLVEEQDVIADFAADWTYDYPPPPFANAPEHPMWDRSIKFRPPQIFQSGNSPTWKEYERLFACYADYQSAIADYERDMKIWNEYWDGFNERYAFNGWRYNE